MIISALLETLVVLSIGPFMAFIADPNLVYENSIALEIYKYLDLKSQNAFLIFLGFAVLSLMIVSAIISIFTTRKISIFGGEIGAELSNRMYKFYIYQTLSFHLKTNSSSISSQLTLEANRMTHSVVIQFLYLNARIILIALMALTIFLTVPGVALLGTFFFALSYICLYWFASKRLERNGIALSVESEKRFKTINESFGGIKDVLLKGLQPQFSKKFINSTNNYFSAWSSSQILTLLPRYAMELAAFGSMVTAILFLLITFDNSIQEVLPILSVFGLASLKMLPAFQQVYFSFSTMKSNINAFFTVKKALENISFNDQIIGNDEEFIPFKKFVEFDNVSFRFDGVDENIISDLSFKINASDSIGIVGASGSGKSTAVNLLVGLLFPSSGSIKIDGIELNNKNLQSWQQKIGYVSQNIYLIDSSIKNNIAFGIDDHEINQDQLNIAINMAQLDELIKSLPSGADTLVGERGAMLSGGQLQRIGIARALYNNPEIIVFDEATSNLDTISESQIMETINALSETKTIIMIAHRLSTVKKCKNIFLFEKGSIIDQGTYQELKKSSTLFHDMT